jgi:hypothetical protein
VSAADHRASRHRRPGLALAGVLGVFGALGADDGAFGNRTAAAAGIVLVLPLGVGVLLRRSLRRRAALRATGRGVAG